MNKAISRLKCDDEIDALFEDLIYVRDLFAEFVWGTSGGFHVLNTDALYLGNNRLAVGNVPFNDRDTGYSWDGQNLSPFDNSTTNYVYNVKDIFISKKIR